MARNRLTRACRRDSDCVRRAVASSHPPRRRSRRVDSSSTALTRRCWLARSARGSARPIRLSMICRTISRQPPRVDRSSAARGARSVPDSLRVTASRERSASSAERLNSSAKPVSPVSAQARKARTSRAKASPNAWSSLRTGVTCSATWLCRRAVRRATAPGRMARASRGDDDQAERNPGLPLRPRAVAQAARGLRRAAGVGWRSTHSHRQHRDRSAVDPLHGEADGLALAAQAQHVEQREIVLGRGHGQHGVRARGCRRPPPGRDRRPRAARARAPFEAHRPFERAPRG